MSDKTQNTAAVDSGEFHLLNMTYGAPELQRFYKKYASIGMAIASGIFVLFVTAYFLFTVVLKADEQTTEETTESRIITLEDLDTPPPTSEDVPPPPDVEVPQTVIPLKDLEALIPEPVAKKEAEVLTTKTQEALQEIKAPVSSEGSENAPNQTFEGKINLQEKKVEQQVEKKEEKKVEKTEFQQFEVEKAPVAVNLGAVRSSMSYPEIARSSGTEGRVTVKVLVGTDGSVVKIGGISGPSVFHDEVRSKVRDLQFTPGLQNGKPVKVWVSVPFNFKLNKGFKKEESGDDDE
jgi:protein TonB